MQLGIIILPIDMRQKASAHDLALRKDNSNIQKGGCKRVFELQANLTFERWYKLFAIIFSRSGIPYIRLNTR